MKKHIKYIIIITIPTLLLLFILSEVGVRVFKTHIDLYELTGIKETTNPMELWAIQDPYCAYMAKPGYRENGKTVNSHGFMSTPEIGLNKKNKTIRLVFLGESSTAGMGVTIKDSLTWPWLTSKELSRILGNKLNIEFINASLGGYTTFESYGKLWSRLIYYQPDIVIVNHGWNDMYYFNQADSALKWRNNFDLKKKIHYAQISPHWIDPWIRWSQILSKIRFWYSARHVQGEKTTEKPHLKDSFNMKGVAIFRNNIRLIKHFCEMHQLQLFICKQPSLIHPQTTEEDKKRCRYDFHGFDHDAHLRAFHELYKVIAQEIPRNNSIDLTSISGKSDCFYDHIHPSEWGSVQIAAIVRDSVLRHGKFHYK